MTLHRIKLEPMYWGPIRDGSKMFEVRYDDRGYAVGDRIEFYWPQFDGGVLRATVTYKLADGRFLLPGYCVLGIRLGWAEAELACDS